MVEPCVASVHRAALDWVGHPVVGKAGTLGQWPHVNQTGANDVETALRNRIVWESRADHGATCRIGRRCRGVVDTVCHYAAEIAGPYLRYRNGYELRVAEHLPVPLVIGEKEGSV